MSLYCRVGRRAPLPPPAFLNHLLRFRSYSASSTTTNHIDHHRTHEFLPPEESLNSWVAPKDPREAQGQLALLRRDYGKKVKAVRKEYIREMELQNLEKLKRDEARMETLKIANQERKAAKEAERKAKAKEREVAEEEFRQTLLKERAEKLEYWRMRTKQVEEKKNEKKELMRRQSSLWVDESQLGKRIDAATCDSTPL